MRLFVINTGHGLSEEDIKIRTDRMKKVVSYDAEITMECLDNTDICIDSQMDAAFAAPEIVCKAIKAEKEKYDAIGIYCTSDPGLRACREAVSIPVVGAGQASFLTAAMLGSRMSFITTSESRISEKVEFARMCGIDISRLASVRSVDYDILHGSGQENHEQLIEKLRCVIEQCIVEDHAETVILGCLSFAGLGPELAQITSIPVIDPAYALISVMESLVHQKLSHSKISYPYPPERIRRWGAGVTGV